MDGERRFSEMSKMDPKEVVRAGCDAVSYAYRDDVEDEDCAGYHAWLDELEPHLPPSVPVLDVGCGCGIPVAKRLAATHPVTGVDISPVQIERARSLVPEGRFLCVDITSVSFPAEHFGGIVAFYSLIHVPLEEQPDLLRALSLAGAWRLPDGHGGSPGVDRARGELVGRRGGDVLELRGPSHQLALAGGCGL